MKTHFYWIDGPWPGRLGILPRPRGGDWLDEEMRSWKNAGADVVVSLLMPDESLELDLEKEAEACKHQGIEFVSFGIPDRNVPASRLEACNLLQRLHGFLVAGRGVAIHCRQGIGRSGLMAGCLLILSGTKPEDAVAKKFRARGAARFRRQWSNGRGSSTWPRPIFPHFVKPSPNNRQPRSEPGTVARLEFLAGFRVNATTREQIFGNQASNKWWLVPVRALGRRRNCEVNPCYLLTRERRSI
jgi:protein-tyrosine phosphatase